MWCLIDTNWPTKALSLHTLEPEARFHERAQGCILHLFTVTDPGHRGDETLLCCYQFNRTKQVLRKKAASPEGSERQDPGALTRTKPLCNPLTTYSK